MPAFKKAEASDLPKILSLQDKYILKNLPPEDQQDGFLSIEYSLSDLERLNNELGIVVAVEDDCLYGYMIAQTIDSAINSPLVKAMVQRFPNIFFQGKMLSELKVFLYGPVCIDKEWRGRGILEGLFAVMIQTLRGQFDVGVAFVSESNPRSMRSHVTKLGMQVVDSFDFGGKKYRTLAFVV